MSPYTGYLRELTAAMEAAAAVPLGQPAAWAGPGPRPGAPVAVICSPHPDDEVITGALALRLRHQAGWRVVNLAVTLGSDAARKEAREAELAACCEAVGFEWVVPPPHGLPAVRMEMRRTDPVGWLRQVDTVGEMLQGLRPAVVFLPHAGDRHPTHIGTHWLVRHALLRARAALPPLHLVETEYWQAMEAPNLLVESTSEDVAALLGALSHHQGEVRRNPYHVTLPLWMADNVRRGSELLGGAGTAAAPFRFGTLYEVRRWADGEPETIAAPRLLPADESPADLFG